MKLKRYEALVLCFKRMHLTHRAEHALSRWHTIGGMPFGGPLVIRPFGVRECARVCASVRECARVCAR
eukprot:SAG31_NODE_1969_length_6771_cov_17.211331_2_plen_68_part_00